jgi:hypothetical protein
MSAEDVRGAMKRTVWVVVFLAAAICCGSRGWAAEARPWLCRIKPVFSSDKPMNYHAVNRGAGRWLLTFMRFDLGGGGHDGFTVESAQPLSAETSGTLASGQWYALALYREGSHWICPGNARESDEPESGVVSDLCYGEDPGACPVKLTVREQSSGGNP